MEVITNNNNLQTTFVDPIFEPVTPSDSSGTISPNSCIEYGSPILNPFEYNNDYMVGVDHNSASAQLQEGTQHQKNINLQMNNAIEPTYDQTDSLQYDTSIQIHNPQNSVFQNLPSPSDTSTDGDKHLAPEQGALKRVRTKFSSFQIIELEREFSNNIFLRRIKRPELAQHLGLSEKQVKVWFQNRRMKLKKGIKKSAAIMSSSGDDSRPAQSSRGVFIKTENSSSFSNRPLNHPEKNSQNTQNNYFTNTSRPAIHTPANMLNSTPHHGFQPPSTYTLPASNNVNLNEYYLNFFGEYLDTYGIYGNNTFQTNVQGLRSYNDGIPDDRRKGPHQHINLESYPAWSEQNYANNGLYFTQ